MLDLRFSRNHRLLILVLGLVLGIGLSLTVAYAKTCSFVWDAVTTDTAGDAIDVPRYEFAWSTTDGNWEENPVIVASWYVYPGTYADLGYSYVTSSSILRVDDLPCNMWEYWAVRVVTDWGKSVFSDSVQILPGNPSKVPFLGRVK